MDDKEYSRDPEGNLRIDPQVSLGEQMDFIDTYRDIQKENTQGIKDETHALGSDLPARMGGLHGGGSYFTDRYQTPQTEARIASLTSVAQSQALSQMMKNDLEDKQHELEKARKRAQARAAERLRQQQLQQQKKDGSVKFHGEGEPFITGKGSITSEVYPLEGFTLSTLADPGSGDVITWAEDNGKQVKVLVNNKPTDDYYRLRNSKSRAISEPKVKSFNTYTNRTA